jgi:anthranilate phosphoribosyltransferase
MKAVLERLMKGESLSRAEAAGMLAELAAGTVDPALAGSLLTALRMKGETPVELAGFAEAMRRLARRPLLPSDQRPLVDIVGTGGDGSSSVNLSTGSALLAAAAGLRVAKHGNRAISSSCGSADVLQALGLPLPLDEAHACRSTKLTRWPASGPPALPSSSPRTTTPRWRPSRRCAGPWVCERSSTCSGP